jgi:hypothetical protein
MTIDLKAPNENQLGELIRRADNRKREIAAENLTKVQKKIQVLLDSE